MHMQKNAQAQCQHSKTKYDIASSMSMWQTQHQSNIGTVNWKMMWQTQQWHDKSNINAAYPGQYGQPNVSPMTTHWSQPWSSNPKGDMVNPRTTQQAEHQSNDNTVSQHQHGNPMDHVGSPTLVWPAQCWPNDDIASQVVTLSKKRFFTLVIKFLP